MSLAVADLVTGGVFNFVSKIVDKVFPDPQQKAMAQAALAQAQSDGELREMAQEMSVMLAEAQSGDKWTSRARPSFLYVVYTLILASIPMGLIYAISPGFAGEITTGFKGWLEAIPQSFIELFGIVMLGYIGGRSFEKIKGAAK